MDLSLFGTRQFEASVFFAFTRRDGQGMDMKESSQGPIASSGARFASFGGRAGGSPAADAGEVSVAAGVIKVFADFERNEILDRLDRSACGADSRDVKALWIGRAMADPLRCESR